MVRQVETRTLEAVKQIRRFLELRPEERDAICSSAIGREVSGVGWSSGVLVRTCLGTEKAWDALNDCVPLNLVLLRLAIIRLSEADDFTFASINDAVEAELSNLRAAAVCGWEKKSFTLFGEKIELPLLNLDYTEIATFRNRAA